MTFQTVYGLYWNPIYLEEQAPGVGLLVITASLSMRCSGFYVPARLGGICYPAMAIGKIPIAVSAVGGIRVLGKNSWRP